MYVKGLGTSSKSLIVLSLYQRSLRVSNWDFFQKQEAWTTSIRLRKRHTWANLLLYRRIDKEKLEAHGGH